MIISWEKLLASDSWNSTLIFCEQNCRPRCSTNTHPSPIICTLTKFVIQTLQPTPLWIRNVWKSLVSVCLNLPELRRPEKSNNKQTNKNKELWKINWKLPPLIWRWTTVCACTRLETETSGKKVQKLIYFYRFFACSSDALVIVNSKTKSTMICWKIAYFSKINK